METKGAPSQKRRPPTYRGQGGCVQRTPTLEIFTKKSKLTYNNTQALLITHGGFMSGGSYNYFYLKIIEFADEVRHRDSTNRKAFKKILYLVAAVAKAIEWRDSGDSSEGGVDDAVCKLFAFFDLKNILKFYLDNSK